MAKEETNHRSGYTKDTAKRLWIDSGVAYKNIEYDKEKDIFVGERIGATSGGVSFAVEITQRQVELDGTSHVQAKGLKVVEEANATLTVPLKELTAQAFKDSIKGTVREAKDDEAPKGYKVIETMREITEDMYADNVGVVGHQPGNSQPIIVILDNAMVSEGIDVSTEDNNEAILEQAWQAHADYDQLQNGEYPWHIYYPPEVESAGGQSIEEPTNLKVGNKGANK